MNVSRVVHDEMNTFEVPKLSTLLGARLSHLSRGPLLVSRRYNADLNGERYVANTSPYQREVHDLDNENRNCIVDELVRGHQYKPFNSLEDARREEFAECPFCCPLIDNSTADIDPRTNALAGIKPRRVA